MTTAWRVAIGIGLLAALVLGMSVLPPPSREMGVALVKAIAVAAYAAFVALSMRGGG